MDTTTFIFVLIGASTAAAAWLFKIVDMIERRPRHEKR